MPIANRAAGGAAWPSMSTIAFAKPGSGRPGARHSAPTAMAIMSGVRTSPAAGLRTAAAIEAPWPPPPSLSTEPTVIITGRWTEISRNSGAAANVLRMIEIPTSTVLLKLAAMPATRRLAPALAQEAHQHEGRRAPGRRHAQVVGRPVAQGDWIG